MTVEIGHSNCKNSFTAHLVTKPYLLSSPLFLSSLYFAPSLSFSPLVTVTILAKLPIFRKQIPAKYDTFGVWSGMETKRANGALYANSQQGEV